MAFENGKRKYSDYDAGDNSESAFQARSNKKRKGSKGGASVKTTSINSVKKRARAIERQFKSGQEIPQNVRNELERELAHHQQSIAKLADDKLRKTMITKYHMVRFFERKKADRLVKQLRSQLESATADEDVKRIKAGLHTAEIDSVYTRYFPHRERYISLYTAQDEKPRSEGKEGEGNSAAQFLQAERPPIWKEIETAVKQGTRALTEIRERRAESEQKPIKIPEIRKIPDVAPPKRRQPAPAPTGPVAGNRRERRKLLASQPKTASGTKDDDDSDGGFFDED